MNKHDCEAPDLRQPAIAFTKYLVVAGGLSAVWFAAYSTGRLDYLEPEVLAGWAVINLLVGLHGSSVTFTLLSRLWRHPTGRTVISIACLAGAVGLFVSAIAILVIAPFEAGLLETRMFTDEGKIALTKMLNLSFSVFLGIGAVSIGTTGLRGLLTCPQQGDAK